MQSQSVGVHSQVSRGCTYAGEAYTSYEIWSSNVFWRTDGAFGRDVQHEDVTASHAILALIGPEARARLDDPPSAEEHAFTNGEHGLYVATDLGVDVNALKANYPPGILEIGQVDGTQYAIMVKFNSKSTMWFRPDKFKTLGVTARSDFAGFVKLLGDIKAKGQAPMGLGASDSWTLTDWFENIYAKQAGPEKYDQLFSGKLPWTDASVAAAVDTMKSAIKEDFVAGGITAALGRGFTDGIAQAFSTNPSAVIYYEGGFVGGIATGQTNTALKVGESIDWFDFPAINNNKTVTIGGDVIAAFTTKPGVKEFLNYMTTADSGSVWAGTGAIISPIKSVPASAYPNDLAKREAAQVANASAVRFDGSDLLPSGGGDALGAALQTAIQGKSVDWAAFETQMQTKWKAEK